MRVRGARRPGPVVVGTLLALCLQATASAYEEGRVALVVGGAPVTLSESERSRIAAVVEALISGCGMTSLAFPNVFATRSLATEWRDARAGSHLYVSFPSPLRTRRGGVQVSEVVVGLQHPTFIGPELSRHDDRVVGHVKCDGLRALELMCATGIRPHLLPTQATSCDAYDEMADPR